MKKLIVTCLIVAGMISCKSNTSKTSSSGSSDTEESTKSEAEKKITKRDFSITPANAYNDLFFDSLMLEKFIADEKPDASIARRMRSFYNARNYQYAWFSSAGLTEQARGFWNVHSYHTTYTNDSLLKDKPFQEKMNDLVAEESLSVNATDKNIQNTELKLTEHFLLYTLNNIEDGYVKRKEMERFIPRKKEDLMLLADSLLTKKHKDGKYYEDVNESYKKLKVELARYVDIARKGGWPTISAPTKQLKKGSSSPEIGSLKKRLQLTGDLAAGDTSLVFDAAVEEGVKKFQARHGYTPTGVLLDVQIKDMNVPVAKRIEQLLINMGRMQWMINQPEGQLMLVNIPEFILHVKEGKSTVFDMNVVVGKEGHNTMMFTGNMNQVVFSPYWNVPVSIVKKEIIPGMASNPNYLASHNMEVTGNAGGIPVVRQLPGEKNSLGKVKFLFPNSFDIYFHDTPAKSLFDKDKRAYSHGCIRLSDPTKLANYVLKDDASWGPENIQAAMNSGEQQFVKLKKPIPVLITYYTAWVDDAGALHFADDIYGHDKTMAAKMFNGGTI
ncbi:MAG: L,D-transpeptidase family protein [Ferruginibacter sp.]|nr:L,D-transpeptidase family protein [Ferruginibacter sp.]